MIKINRITLDFEVQSNKIVGEKFDIFFVNNLFINYWLFVGVCSNSTRARLKSESAPRSFTKLQTPQVIEFFEFFVKYESKSINIYL